VEIAALATTLPGSQWESDTPSERFAMPGHAITTAKCVIVYEAERSEEGDDEDYWSRFLRIESNGAIEYCDCTVVEVIKPMPTPIVINVFRYVQMIGVIWTFLYAARRILNLSGYDAGVRYRVNVSGTKDSVLVQFASRPGLQEQLWRQPFEGFEKTDH